MSFQYEKTTIDGKEGIRILTLEGAVRKLNVPESLEGLPVLSLGKQAVSENNRGLEEVTLPSTLLELESFAFSFCDSLKKITLPDSILHVHDGAIRTCFGLRDLEIIMKGWDFTLARRLLGDSDRKLRVLFRFPDHVQQLVFPDYYSNSIEDTKSQAFHIRIDGCGFSYRECVSKTGLRMREYDSLFQRAVISEDEDTPIEIAAARLLYPQGLHPDPCSVYRGYLTEHMEESLKLAFLPGNEEWMELFIKEELLSEKDIDLALKLASSNGCIQLAGELLEYKNRHFEEKKPAVLSLEDW